MNHADEDQQSGLSIVINTAHILQLQLLPSDAETRTWLSLIQRCLLRVLASVLRERPLERVSLYSCDRANGFRSILYNSRSLDDLSSSLYDLECGSSTEDKISGGSSIPEMMDALRSAERNFDKAENSRLLLLIDCWHSNTSKKSSLLPTLDSIIDLLRHRDGYLIGINWPQRAANAAQLALEPAFRVIRLGALTSEENIPKIAELSNDIIYHFQRRSQPASLLHAPVHTAGDFAIPAAAAAVVLTIGSLSTRVCVAESVYAIEHLHSQNGLASDDRASSRTIFTPSLRLSTSLPGDLIVRGFISAQEAVCMSADCGENPLAGVPVVITSESDQYQYLLSMLNRSMCTTGTVAVVSIGENNELGILRPLAICLQRECTYLLFQFTILIR